MFSPEVDIALKAARAELEQRKARHAMLDIPRTAPQQSVERRVERIQERLGQGGEIAQSVVRELFPDGIWLTPDPDGGRFLWACTQTALSADWLTRVDEKGYLPAEFWPRVYSAIATAGPIATPTVKAAEKVGNSMVAGARYLNIRLSLAA